MVFSVVVFVAGVAVANAAAPLPDFDEATFSNPTVINNPWLALPIGRGFEYEGETDEGTEVVEIEIDGSTKIVNGVRTLIYRDKVYVDGELVEDTRDYLAQDDDGNVWYFGEDVDNYEDGEIADHDGSWLVGVDGAKPGYWMPGNPTVGMRYRQEYLDGEAEDEAEVISLTEKVKIGLGTYTNCLKTKDTTPLEPDVVEYKYYCKQVGGLVLEEKPEDGERVELVEYETEVGDDEEVEDDEGDDDDDGDDDDEDDSDSRLGVDRQSLIRQLITLLERLIAKLR